MSKNTPAPWSHKDQWSLSGREFLVMVSRHSASTEGAWEGPNRWCVYAYLYPRHPYFSKFEGSKMWQEAASNMPLHGGPSFLQWHWSDEGVPCSIQVGCDYNHIGDEHYTYYSTKDEAHSVFADAEELVEWLAARAAPKAEVTA